MKSTMNRFIWCFAVAALLFALPEQAHAKKRKKDRQETRAEKAPYEKIFDGKKTKTARGLVTLHKVEGEIYLEVADSMLGRQMLAGATVVSVSDGNESSEGMQTSVPKQIVFRRTDSLLQIARINNNYLVDDGDEGIGRALEAARQPSVEASFPILAVSPDSSGVIVKATPFFMNGGDFLSPKDPQSYNSHDGLVFRTYKYRSGASYIKDVASFGDNASVIAELSYDVSSYVFGLISMGDAEPFSATVRVSFMLLPDKMENPREADTRVGTATSRFIEYSGEKQGAAVRYFANRWRLEPAAGAPFTPCAPSEPVNPIVFYLDERFPSAWKPYITNGVKVWNEAFERAGILNAIEVRCAATDSLPDINDIRYSAIRYVPSPAKDIRHNVWTDPRTGEILSANIYISHNIGQKIQTERLLQTGAADPRARTLFLDDEVFGESLTQKVAHHVGLCLGLLPNKGASQTVPVDSLRSASYTSLNALSPSIMDELPLNYVARPEDFAAGVRLCQATPGEYDSYAIGWLYGDGQPVRGELPYRFLRGQTDKFSLDPRAVSGDLADDALRAADYGLENLATVMRDMPEWVDDEDRDYSYREAFPESVYYYFSEVTAPVLAQLGGVYINERYAGDGNEYFTPVPADVQKRAMKWSLDCLDNLSRFDNKALVVGEGLNPGIADFIRLDLFSRIMKSMERIALSASLSDGGGYTRVDALGDISAYMWNNRDATAEEDKQPMQSKFVDELIKLCGSEGAKSPRPTYFPAPEAVGEAGEVEAIQPVASISYLTWPEEKHLIYGLLVDCRDKISRAMARTASNRMKSHYALLLHKIEVFFDND